MKTTKFFTALSLTFILLASSFVFAPTPAKSAIPKIPPSTRQSVTYVVMIDKSGNPNSYAGVYFIGITNDRGMAVAPPQEFHPGIWTYYFTEYGTTFTGSRTAHMNSAMGAGVRPGILVTPVTLPGPFKATNSYTFWLMPY